MRFKLPLLIVNLLLTGMLSACGKAPPEPANTSEQATFIFAVNNPLQYFAKRLLGDDIEVRMPGAAGDPAQWQPSVDDILQLQQAEVILLNGAGYSNWLDKVSLADSALVVTSDFARDKWIALENQVTHSHGPQGEHAHVDYAFTIWMDMTLAQNQASTIADALARRWPKKRQAIETRLTSLLTDLQALDQGYLVAARRLQGRRIVYSHPVYQYFERRYGLGGISLHWEPDQMPTAEQWKALARLQDESLLLVWEAEPVPAIASKLQEMDIEFLVLEPAASAGEADWLSVQQQNLARLAAVR